MKKPVVAVAGATGVVGNVLLEVLKKKGFPLEKLLALASERSAGKKISTPFGRLTVGNADKADYSKIDIVLASAGSGWSKENAQRIVDAGCTYIDNSSCFRYDPKIPLIIPQINRNDVGDSKLIANPNCTTAIAAIPLYQIYLEYGIKRAIISTYQSTSGAGRDAMIENVEQTKAYLQGKNSTKELVGNTADYVRGKKVKVEQFPHPIAFNVIPRIDSIQDNNYTKEEMKTVWETRKIFGNKSLKISTTCVRVPTLRVHSEDVTVQTKEPVYLGALENKLRHTDGVEVVDDVRNDVYPMPLTATGKYDVEVGRLRHDLTYGEKSVKMWVSGDQLLRGAALNAVEIAELVLDRDFR
ncbi:aspartate-semialdehyde dehydrogenase [Nanoarchaeota archaeon]